MIEGSRPLIPAPAALVANSAQPRVSSGQAASTTSRRYDAVFRNGQLAGWAPETSTKWQQTRPVAADEDLAEWRRLTHVTLGGDGTKELTFPVQVPRRAGLKAVTWSAYAFNEDRVKGATATRTEPVPPGIRSRRGKAYVITVGVNRIAGSPSWDLRYAVNDARRLGGVVAERLRATNQFEEVVSIRLVADVAARAVDEGPATRTALRVVLDRLAGRPLTIEQLATVPGLAQGERAQPEDLVLLAVSSHGYTVQGVHLCSRISVQASRAR